MSVPGFAGDASLNMITSRYREQFAGYDGANTVYPAMLHLPIKGGLCEGLNWPCYQNCAERCVTPECQQACVDRCIYYFPCGRGEIPLGHFQ